MSNYMKIAKAQKTQEEREQQIAKIIENFNKQINDDSEIDSQTKLMLLGYSFIIINTLSKVGVTEDDITDDVLQQIADRFQKNSKKMPYTELVTEIANSIVKPKVFIPKLDTIFIAIEQQVQAIDFGIRHKLSELLDPFLNYVANEVVESTLPLFEASFIIEPMEQAFYKMSNSSFVSGYLEKFNKMNDLSVTYFDLFKDNRDDLNLVSDELYDNLVQYAQVASTPRGGILNLFKAEFGKTRSATAFYRSLESCGINEQLINQLKIDCQPESEYQKSKATNAGSLEP